MKRSRKMSLRPYQSEAADAVEQSLHIRENPLTVIPTGGGKSLVIAETIRRLVRRPSRPGILVLSHVKELIEQNSRVLRAYEPSIAQGVYSAGLREKRGAAQVVLGTVQTVSRSLNALHSRAYILIDEAHLCPREQDSQYGKVFEHFGLAQRVGFTATNMRLDSGSLTVGEDRWFDTVTYEVPVGDLIAGGWLVPLAGVMTEQQALLDDVRTRAGDFIAEQAEDEVMKLSLDEVVGELLKLSAMRQHILVFAAGVRHARSVHARLQAEGIETELVLGDTADGERAESIARFRSGEVRALVSVGVLTTGFDAPLVDCIACLRPTKSPVLWSQMLGRGMRPAPGKSNCLLLDFVGNLSRLGGAGCVLEIEDHRKEEDERRPARPGSGSGKAQPAPEFEAASNVDPMTGSPLKPFDARVLRMRSFIIPSRSQPGKRILCVDYSLETAEGLKQAARAFLCVEYSGYARMVAERWFRRRSITPAEVPHDAQTAHALVQVLDAPERITAQWDPKQRGYAVLAEHFRNGPQSSIVF